MTHDQGSDRGGACVPDPDFELLENYLDGELSEVEVRRVENRLVAEPELAAALARMGAEQAVRRVVFESLEPNDAAARDLGRAVAASARRSDLRRMVVRFARVAGAVAACVVLFLAGFGVGRGQAAPQPAIEGPDPARIARGSTTRPASPVAHVARPGEPTPSAAAPRPANETSYVYHVALTDEAGNITAVQKFDSLEDARQFAAEVGRWQARHQQIQNGNVVMTTTKF